MGLGPVGFDLDMTLIDSRPAIMAAFEAMSRDMSASIDLDAVDSRLGVKLEDELAYWFPPEGIVQAASCYRRHYVRLAADKTAALPGAQEALAVVRAKGERAVIITAKHPVSVEPSLRAAGLTADELFTHVHGQEKAEVLRRIRAAVYVGDTPPDITAGISAGVRAVGVATGSFTAADLRRAGAQPVLVTLEAFPAWYQELNDR
jgi:phosphoglycolate phosphatase